MTKSRERKNRSADRASRASLLLSIDSLITKQARRFDLFAWADVEDATSMVPIHSQTFSSGPEMVTVLVHQQLVTGQANCARHCEGDCVPSFVMMRAWRNERATLSLVFVTIMMAASANSVWTFCYGVFYGREKICSKSAQLSATPCKPYSLGLPMIRNAVQHSENVRNSLGLNYKSVVADH
jgi:hypothetical protein